MLKKISAANIHARPIRPNTLAKRIDDISKDKIPDSLALPVLIKVKLNKLLYIKPNSTKSSPRLKICLYSDFRETPFSKRFAIENGNEIPAMNKNNGNINNISPSLNWDTASADAIAYVKFTVTVEQAGNYQVNIYYNGNDNKSILVKLNDYAHTVISLPTRDGGTGDWNHLFNKQIILGDFEAGTNTVWVSGTIGGGWTNVDCIDIKNTPEP